MNVRDLKRIAAALPEEDDDMPVEFHDATHGRRCPINGWGIKPCGPGEQAIGQNRLVLTNAFDKQI